VRWGDQIILVRRKIALTVLYTVVLTAQQRATAIFGRPRFCFHGPDECPDAGSEAGGCVILRLIADDWSVFRISSSSNSWAVMRTPQWENVESGSNSAWLEDLKDFFYRSLFISQNTKKASSGPFTKNFRSCVFFFFKNFDAPSPTSAHVHRLLLPPPVDVRARDKQTSLPLWNLLKKSMLKVVNEVTRNS